MVHAHSRSACHCRSAFTLVELLLVISIIAMLVGIGTAVYFATMGNTQVGVTKTMLQKLQVATDNQWAAVTAQARKETLPPSSSAFPVWSPTGNSDLDRGTWIMLRQQQAYPRSFAEVFAAPPDGPTPGYLKYLGNYGVTGSINNPALESSACLLMALQRGVDGAGYNPDNLGKASVKTFPIAAGQAPTLPALVDGWGNPIWFAFQSAQASGQWQLTPILRSSGKDGIFQTQVTPALPFTPTQILQINVTPFNVTPFPIPPGVDDLSSK